MCTESLVESQVVTLQIVTIKLNTNKLLAGAVTGAATVTSVNCRRGISKPRLVCVMSSIDEASGFKVLIPTFWAVVFMDSSTNRIATVFFSVDFCTITRYAACRRGCLTYSLLVVFSVCDVSCRVEL